MECPQCRSGNREGVKFCEECGAPMEMGCPGCGAKIPLGKKFCGECGHRLEEPPPAPALDLTQPTSYTPKHLAEKILTTRSSIEGERKIVKEGDQENRIGQNLKERLLALDERLSSGLSAFEDLFSLPVQDQDWGRLEPKEKRDRTFEALRDLIIRLSAERPLILVIDDLHWLDKTSEEFLDYFIGGLAEVQKLRRELPTIHDAT